MFREIREWIHLIFLYGLLYSTAVIVLILGVVHLSNNDTLLAHSPQHNHIEQLTSNQSSIGRSSGYEPDVCTRIDGCVVKNGVCLTCEKSNRDE